MSLVWAVEDLYRGVVIDPESWNEQMFIDWSEGLTSEAQIDASQAKYVRRAMRQAQKIRTFWLAADPDPGGVWQSRVDVAAGPKAWRPVLDLAVLHLSSERSEEAFADVTRLFRLVNNESFLDGIGFEQWSQLHQQS